jgi:hypothetical protein
VSVGVLPLTSISYTHEKVADREGIAAIAPSDPVEFGALASGTVSKSPPARQELI